MKSTLILASKSKIRHAILEKAGIEFTALVANIDEDSIKESMLSEGQNHDEIAIELAKAKARKISNKNPHAIVIGCDQVLSFGNDILSKPKTKADAISQLESLRNAKHTLISAIVITQNGTQIWHHVSHAHLTMLDFSDAYLRKYVRQNWHSIQHSVGGYKIEEQGIRLFAHIDGDHFTILGLPLLELLAYLRMRGDIET